MADVMERLSAANPVPECSPPSIDEVWRRLEQSSTADEPPATGTTAGADRSGRRRRPDLALVGVGLSVLVVVAMFVGALALLHHREATRKTSTAASTRKTSSAASSQQDLLRTLGVLRTAQTATDRALAACIARFARTPASAAVPSCPEDIPGPVFVAAHLAQMPVPIRNRSFAGMRDPRFDLALIRSVPVAGWAEHVTIFPFSFRSSRPSAPRTWGVVVNLVNNNTKHEALDIGPTSLRALRAHGIAMLPGGNAPGARLTGFTVHPGAIIVPDGVAKVMVGTVIDRGGPGRSLRVVENVTAVVHDNVATVPLRTPTYIGGLPPSDPGGVPKTLRSFGFDDGSTTLQMTWLDAHGKVIKHTTTTNVTADGGQGPAL